LEELAIGTTDTSGKEQCTTTLQTELAIIWVRIAAAFIPTF
jgi:hypothetical protein